MDDRKRMGKYSKDVIIPVAPDVAEFGDEYENFIEKIKENIRNQQVHILLQANKDMICMYWHMGKAILKKQEEEGWGAKVIDRISQDLKNTFPDMKGFSPRNIKYMKKFALVWEDEEIVQQLVAQLPWGTNIVLMDKLSTQEERIWYAQKTLENGWSRNVLSFQIDAQLYSRTGQSVNNFHMSLPAHDSDMVNQVFKDPYLFDFLGTDAPRRELDIEKKLTEHIQEFLLELGQGLLLVKGKNKTVVEYSLEGYNNPIGVADWKQQLSAGLLEEIQSNLPTIEQIERELEKGNQ